MPPRLTLKSVLEMLWRQRVVMQLSVAVAVILSIVYMHLASPVYTVTLQLVPAPSATDKAGGLSGALGALASMGLGGNAGGNQTFKVFEAGLQSHAAGAMIAKDPALMHRIFADQWSEEDHAWRLRPGLLHYFTGPVKAVLGMYNAPRQPPNALSVYDYLQKNVMISESRDTPILTVTMRNKDPRFAADFLTALTRYVDEMMRQQALSRANSYIAYLNDELKHVENSELRASLIDHLSDQEKQRMMASAKNVSYVADVFSGPAPSARPTSPALPVALIGSLLFCSVVGFLIAWYLDSRGITLVLLGYSRGFRAVSIRPTDDLAGSLSGVERHSPG